MAQINKFTKVTQLVTGEAGIQTQAVWFQKSDPYPLHSTAFLIITEYWL